MPPLISPRLLTARRTHRIPFTVAFTLAAALAMTSLMLPPPHRAQAQGQGPTFSYTQITTNSADQTDPAISGNYIVYTDSRNGNKDIYLYNLATKTETDLTPGTSTDQYLDDVSGSNVVYTNLTAQGGSDIYLFDVANSETIPLATGNYDYGPAISGNYVTWVHVSGTTRAIVLADLATETLTTLTREEALASGPRVDGNTVVWEEYVSEYRQIFTYNITTGVTRQLTNQPCDHQDPDVSGRYVVWADLCSGNWDISLYDLDTGATKQLTTSTAVQIFPRISGERVVWLDNQTGVSQVWTMYLPEGVAYPVESTTTDQFLGTIDGDHIVWAEPRYGNYDIFMATVTEDTTPPTTSAALTPPANSTGWNNSDVTVTLTAEDNPGGSGVASLTYSATGAQSIPATTVEGASATLPPVTAEGTTVITYSATDHDGNVESPQTVSVNLDKTAPTISLTSPQDGATYLLQEPVNATYSATDALSGLASLSGTAPSGAPIDTSSLGTHSFSVTASDKAGNTATTTVSYTVAPPSWGSGLLPPINPDGSSVFKLGAVIPVKFALSGASASVSPPPVATLYLKPLANNPTGQLFPATSAGQANTGNQFRNDPTTQQYIYSLSTQGLAAGRYELVVYIDGDKDTGVLLGAVQISLQ